MVEAPYAAEEILQKLLAAYPICWLEIKTMWSADTGCGPNPF